MNNQPPLVTAGAPRIAALFLAILVTAALLNGLFLPLAGRNARPEHIAAPLVFVAFVVWQGLRKQTAVRLDAFSGLAVGWVAVNALSSWLYAPQPSESFVHVVRISFLVAIFLTVANLPFQTGAQWTVAFRLWLTLGLLELAYGLVVWGLAQYGRIWLYGVVRHPSSAGITINGTQLERNLFGILGGTLLVVAIYCLLTQRFRRERLVASTAFLTTATALAGLMVVLALTRSAWLAVVAVGPLAYLVFDRRRPARADRPLLLATVALPLLLGVLIAALQVLPTPPDRPAAATAAPATSSSAETPSGPSPRAPASAVRDRLDTLGRLDSDLTINTRIQDARWALDDWWASPILGHGTGSFVQIHGRRVGTDAWISNLILHTMVDTGLVGLAIQMSLFVLVGWRAWHAALVTADPRLELGLKALTLGLLVMGVAYQFTDGTWLAVFWIHLAFMVNGIYRVAGKQHAARVTPVYGARST
jgi:hypothetical protein